MKTYEIQPSARRLIGSLRDIGYNFNTAIADLVDNSIAAGATHVQIDLRFDGASSSVIISDDGRGMTESNINEAFRFGSERAYSSYDLGRFGLGLKTASLSQCRRLTVLSRRSELRKRVSARQLDLERVDRTDQWEITEPSRTGNLERADEMLSRGPGTVVVWEDLDRILGPSGQDGGWARRRLVKLIDPLGAYLGMVFHRYLAGEVAGRDPLHISVNGEKVDAWNPFAPGESTIFLLPLRWEITSTSGPENVVLKRAVLPPRDEFSSHDEFERLAGPLKWNRQQGLYVYRSNRLIQGGGWAGIRTIDEHTKLARASLDFPSTLDELFHVNVAKMRVSVPPEVRTMLEAPVNELCREADVVYRSEASSRAGDRTEPQRAGGLKTADGAALAVRASAMVAGMTKDQLAKFEAHLRENHPEVAKMIGL